MIEELQASRSLMVHLSDELVRTIPEGVRLSSIKQAGTVLTLEGLTQSMPASPVHPCAGEFRLDGAPGPLGHRDQGGDRNMPYIFNLKVNLVQPKDENAEAEATGVDNERRFDLRN